MIVTFVAGGKRGGTCKVDVDCDDVDDNDVRSIQQRLQFDPVGCTPTCDCVQLTDAGATANDPSCATVTSSTLNEQICATEVAGTQTVRQVTGTVSCAGGECMTSVTNTAELSCEDASLITGSPASASFSVTCNDGNGGIKTGDFCSQTQGGWGTKCAGNNRGCLRDMFFDDVFPLGLIVGDATIDGAANGFAILLTSAAAVEAYLPAGGMPAALTADQTNPLVTSSGVFGGQLVAATLNVAFDGAGLELP